MLIKTGIEKKQILKQLEKEYQELVFKRDDLIRQIEEFNHQYNLKFASLLNQILELKEENIYKKITLRKLKKQKLLKDKKTLEFLKNKKNKLQIQLDKVLHSLKLEENDILKAKKEELEIALSEVNSQIKFINDEKERLEIDFSLEDDENLEFELNEAQEDKKEFNKELNEAQKIEELEANELKELKKIYRKISKMIHPDIVDDEYKKEASELMAKLNLLYKFHRLNEIKEIYLQLQNKNFVFISDILDEDELLQNKIYKIKDKIVDILKEIDQLKSSEIFEILKNKEEYFREINQSLTERLNDLKNEKSYLDINIEKYKDLKV